MGGGGGGKWGGDDTYSTVNRLKFGYPKNCCISPEIGTVTFYYRVIGPNNGEEWQTV